MGQYQGKASGWDQLGQEQACPLHGQPSPSPGCWPRSWPLSANCLVQARLWLPPGHESDSHPGVSAGAGTSIPAGHGHFQGRHFQGAESSASNTCRIHSAVVPGSLGRNTQAREEQNTGRFAGWKTGGVRRNLGNGSNGSSIPQVLLGLEMLSVGFVGDGFIAPFHLQHTLEEVLGTKILKSGS